MTVWHGALPGDRMRAMTEDTFKSALEAHRSKHDNPWSLDAQRSLQALHLQRADVLEATGDPAALAHLRVAEDAQWLIGTESGAPDTAGSMARLYEIRARRARLHERLGEPAVALDLWLSIAADPNGLGAFAAPEIARLEAT